MLWSKLRLGSVIYIFLFSLFNNAVRLYKPWKTALRFPLWPVRGGNGDRVYTVPGDRVVMYTSDVWYMLMGCLFICYISSPTFISLFRFSHIPSKSLLYIYPVFILLPFALSYLHSNSSFSYEVLLESSWNRSKKKFCLNLPTFGSVGLYTVIPSYFP
jgi:hypothetical protein